MEENGTGALCVGEDGDGPEDDEQGVRMRACCGSWKGIDKQMVRIDAPDGVAYVLCYTAVVCVRRVQYVRGQNIGPCTRGARLPDRPHDHVFCCACFVPQSHFC